MYIDNFEFALRKFDEVLDQMARAARAKNNWTTITIDDGELNDCCKKLGTKFGSDILKDVKGVIFNDPATIVTFSDGSKVCVKTCGKDKYSKELGLVYAVLKRIYADGVDANGYFKASGLGAKLNTLIENGIDQKEVEKKRIEEKTTNAKTSENDVVESPKKSAKKNNKSSSAKKNNK